MKIIDKKSNTLIVSFSLFIILQSEASSTDGPGEPGGDVHGPTQAGDQDPGEDREAAVRAGPRLAERRPGGAGLHGAAAECPRTSSLL